MRSQKTIPLKIVLEYLEVFSWDCLTSTHHSDTVFKNLQNMSHMTKYYEYNHGGF